MTIFYEQSERIYSTIPRSLYELLVKKANENMRSLSAQIAYALKEQYKDELLEIQRLSHDEGGKREV